MDNLVQVRARAFIEGHGTSDVSSRVACFAANLPFNDPFDFYNTRAREMPTTCVASFVATFLLSEQHRMNLSCKISYFPMRFVRLSLTSSKIQTSHSGSNRLNSRYTLLDSKSASKVHIISF